MKSKIILTYVVIICITFSCQSVEQLQVKPSESNLQISYPNVLDLSGIPVDPTDRSVYSFSDLGAWHGYALPKEPSGGFKGPYLMTNANGIWLSKALTNLDITLGDEKLNWTDAVNFETNYYPGKLVLKCTLGSLFVTQELIFISDRSAMINCTLKNTGESAQLSTSFSGNTWLKGWKMNEIDNKLHITSPEENTFIQLQFSPIKRIELEEHNYRAIIQDQTTVNKGEELSLTYSHTACFTSEEMNEQEKIIELALADPDKNLESNKERWQTYLHKTLTTLNGNNIDSSYHRLAVKSLNTLINNWRSAAGELKHDGLFPSYAYGGFHGFWAWDSWKHSVGLADIVPELAKDQIRAMYDYQDATGMIADCIFRDTLIEKHNWRDTKPPLSGWAIYSVFEATSDTSFVTEMFPKLKKYHQWWYDYRDHDSNGLCEYGSTDGTRVAAAWESGMDNAVRFDHAIMLKNEPDGWSLNQESVDLNAYLFSEKKYLSQLSVLMGKHEQARVYKTESKELLSKIRNRFFDKEVGFFYDVMHDGKMIKINGPEGWIPLWSGIAEPSEAESSKKIMMNESIFNTKVPLPTLDASHDDFNPKKGYWRGPVWIDQFYFGVKGLENYGYHNESTLLKKKLFNNADGLLLSDKPIRENYHPITGEGLNASHFSWSAAHILMLIREQ